MPDLNISIPPFEAPMETEITGSDNATPGLVVCPSCEEKFQWPIGQTTANCPRCNIGLKAAYAK